MKGQEAASKRHKQSVAALAKAETDVEKAAAMKEGKKKISAAFAAEKAVAEGRVAVPMAEQAERAADDEYRLVTNSAVGILTATAAAREEAENRHIATGLGALTKFYETFAIECGR